MKQRKEQITMTLNQKRLDKALKVLQEKLDEEESKELQEVLDYLKSLKPELPKFVIDWVKSKSHTEAFKQLNSENPLDGDGEAVRQWFWDFWERAENYAYFPSWVVMKTIVNMGQFGTVVKEDDLYYIKAPSGFDDNKPVYLCDGINSLYGLTTERIRASKFTEARAYKTMAKLRIQWDLEKVE